MGRGTPGCGGRQRGLSGGRPKRSGEVYFVNGGNGDFTGATGQVERTLLDQRPNIALELLVFHLHS